MKIIKESLPRVTDFRWLILLILLLIAACGDSGWTEMAIEDGGIVYVMHAETKKVAHRTTLTVMLDLANPQPVADKRYSSVVMLRQYDCLDNKWKSLKYDFFSDNMGKGVVVDSWATDDNWIPRNFKAGSFETMWELACG